MEWRNVAECKWRIDSEGCLTIAPGGSRKKLLDCELDKLLHKFPRWPWEDYSDDILSIKIEPGVKASTLFDIFCGCKNLTHVDLAGLDAQNVTSMDRMFSGCENLKSLDLSSLNTSNVTFMVNMFACCTSLTSVNFNSLDTSKVRTMAGMFYECSSLTTMNLSSLDLTNVGSIRAMFCGCKKLTSVDLAGLEIAKLKKSQSEFMNKQEKEASLMSGRDKQNWLGRVAQTSSPCIGAFCGCSSLTSLNIPPLFYAGNNICKENFQELFAYCKHAPIII